MTRVAFRVDADASIGTGHLVRCLTLAARLAERGATITFVGRPYPPPVAARVIADGHRIVPMTDGDGTSGVGHPWPEPAQHRDAMDTLAAAAGELPDVLVVDHYGLGRSWEQQVATVVGRLVAIDDLADRTHDVDLLVDSTWVGPTTAQRYDDLVPPRTKRLLGPRYVLLQAAYARLRPHRRPAKDRERILVSFGGSDPTGESVKTLAALDGWPGRAEVDLVIGGAVEDRDRLVRRAAALPGVRVHTDLPTLADLFLDSRAAIGAGGATTWERICLGVPGLVTTVAANQIETAVALDRAGAIRWVGEAATTGPATYRQALEDAAKGRVGEPPPLVDGLGAVRVAQAILPGTAPSLSVRPATADDGPVFIGADHGLPGVPCYLDGPWAWEAGLDLLEQSVQGAGLAAGVVLADDIPVGGVLRGIDETSPRVWLDEAVVGVIDPAAVRAEAQRPGAIREVRPAPTSGRSHGKRPG